MSTHTFAGNKCGEVIPARRMVPLAFRMPGRSRVTGWNRDVSGVTQALPGVARIARASGRGGNPRGPTYHRLSERVEFVLVSQ
jgi:hypothetical protein